MKALITGVTGFAGTHLAEQLLASGDEVIGCSASGAWSADVPGELPVRVPLFAWDMGRGLTRQVLDIADRFAPQAIYHLAAISVPSDCGEREPAAAALAVNLDGTRAAIELTQALARPPRLLFASSCYVYAPVTAERPVVAESAPLAPAGGYGKTKLAAEQAIREAGERGRLNAVVARAFQHSGPRQSPRMILPDWARQFAESGSQPLRIVCRDAYLDLSDVRDVVRAYRALVVDGRAGTVYNVGSGVCRRSGDLLDQFQKIVGRRREIVELSPGRRQHPVADIARIKSHTGWEPVIPMQTTLQDIWDFWLARNGES